MPRAAVKEVDLEEEEDLEGQEEEKPEKPKPAQDRSRPAKVEEEREVEVGAPVEESRAERRRNRFAENRRAAEEATARAVAAEQALQEERTRRTVIETNWEMARRQEQEKQKPSKLEEESKALAAEHQGLVDQFEALRAAQTLTPEKADAIRQRAVAISERRAEIAAEKVLERQRPHQPQHGTREEFIRQHIEMNYPDVVAHPQARGHFIPTFQALVAEGEPDNMATLNKALQTTRVRFGLASAAPSEATRRRTSGVSAGAGGGVGGGGVQAKAKYKPTKSEEQMAVELYKHLPREKAIQKWVNEVGSKGDD